MLSYPLMLTRQITSWRWFTFTQSTLNEDLSHWAPCPSMQGSRSLRSLGKRYRLHVSSPLPLWLATSASSNLSTWEFVGCFHWFSEAQKLTKSLQESCAVDFPSTGHIWISEVYSRNFAITTLRWTIQCNTSHAVSPSSCSVLNGIRSPRAFEAKRIKWALRWKSSSDGEAHLDWFSSWLLEYGLQV